MHESNREAAAPPNPYAQPDPGARPAQPPSAYQPPTFGQQSGVAAYAPAASGTALSSEKTRKADTAVQLSLAFGILAMSWLPLIFGPLAIWQGNRAESLGRSGTVGRTLGWIATLLGLLVLVAVVAWVYYLRTGGLERLLSQLPPGVV